MYIWYPLPYVHRVPPYLMYIGYPLPYGVIYRSLIPKKNKTQLMGALHAACLKSAADGPRADRYTDFSGARTPG